MNKELKLLRVHSGKRLLSVLFDYISIALGAVLLYFILLYAFFTPAFDYHNKNQAAKNIENQYSLNYGNAEEYAKYEKVVQDFYFTYYPEEIKNAYNTENSTDYSIYHIYNIEVLRLPASPTMDYYSTDLFEYKLNADGTFSVDELGIVKANLGGATFEKNMADTFYSSYSNLKLELVKYNSEYNNLTALTSRYEFISRTVAISLSVITFYIVIPFINQNGATLFEKVYDIGHVAGKNGFKVKPVHIILRALIAFLLPIGGIVIFNKYTIILMTIFYIFLNNLILIFNKNNRDIPDILLNMDACFVSESLIFKNFKEQKAYEQSDEFKQIEEQNFVERLSGIKEISTKKEK